MSSHHEFVGDCEKCGSYRGLGTDKFADEVGYEILCRPCLRDIVPERWGVKASV